MRDGKTRRLATDAMLCAIYVVLSLLSANLPDIKVSLDSLPILVGAMLLGPVDGLAVGLLGSFISQMLTYGFSVTTPLWMLPAGVRGLMVGLYAKRHGFELSLGQTEFITILSALTVTVLNTGAKYADSIIYGYYSRAYVFGSLALRIVLGIITAAALAAILPTLLRGLKKRLHINITEE